MKHSGISKAHNIGIILVALSLFLISAPRSWSLYPLGISLLTGFFLWIFDFREIRDCLRKQWLLVLPPISYFLLHLISLVLSMDSLIILEDRLMFLLVPVFLFPILSRKLSNKDFIVAGLVYFSGISIILGYLLIRVLLFVGELVPPDSTLLEYAKLHSYWFFSTNFSILEHPSYLSLKIIWLQILLFYLLFSQKKGRMVIVAIIGVLAIFLSLLASRAAILAFIILILMVSIFYLSLLRKSRILLIPLLIIVLFIIGTVFLRVPKIQNMVAEIRSADWINQDNWQNYDQRTREWYSALQLIKEKPIFGHGLAKVEERMVREYRIHGWEEEASLNLNAHNQYLEAQMTFGIAGTLSLLWMLLTPIVLRKRLRYPKLAVAFVLMVSFFLLFESMFNRQWGIMFFVLFYCLLVFPLKNDTNNIPNEDLANQQNN